MGPRALVLSPVRPDLEIKMSQSGNFAAVVILVAFASAAQAQDTTESIKNGAQAYRICATCHSLQPGVHLSGPSLAGLWGKKAATIKDFSRYTDALKNVDIVWDENTLNAWLAKPEAMAPGTTMLFRGVENEKTRGELIAFLRQALAMGGTGRAVNAGLISKRIADGQIPEDLSSVGPNQRITELSRCGDAYHVTTADGAKYPFWETNVRLKIDTSPRGPKKGTPVLLRAGMAGDRVSVVFSSLSEVGQLVSEKCAN